MAAHRIDLTGQKFGRLTVIKFDRIDRYTNGRIKLYWLCKCECGNEKSVVGRNLKQENVKSCGCLTKESIKRGGLTYGLTDTPEYAAWNNAIERCTNPHHESFFRYGMRGISVCDRWLNSFVNFICDMGSKPTPNHQLDRVNNNGNYEPSNCKWSTTKEQTRNRRTNHWIEYNGRKMVVADWERELGTGRSCIQNSLKRGRSEKEAIEYYINKNAMKCK